MKNAPLLLVLLVGCASPQQNLTERDCYFVPYQGEQKQWRVDVGGFPDKVEGVTFYKIGYPTAPYELVGELSCLLEMEHVDDVSKVMAEHIRHYGGTGAILRTSRLRDYKFLTLSYYVIKEKQTAEEFLNETTPNPAPEGKYKHQNPQR